MTVAPRMSSPSPASATSSCGGGSFGVEVARRLAAPPPLPGVSVAEFGVRSVDLTFALLEGCDVAIVVDATRRGGAPGSLYVIEPSVPEGHDDLERRARALRPIIGLDPTKVLAYVRAVGGKLASLRVVRLRAAPRPASRGRRSRPPRSA